MRMLRFLITYKNMLTLSLMCNTKSKSISFPVNKGLLVPSAYQETMIQHILSVFVVVANFYARYFSIWMY